MNHMIEQNNYAFIAKCPSRKNEIQIGFGNIAMSLALKDYDQFAENIIDIYSQYYHCNSNCKRKFMMQTSLDNMVFMFTKQELNCLCDTILKANLIIEANSIISQKS